jgi:phage terminase small subunit
LPKLQNKKHELFCLAYIECNLNATEAYSRVYPKAKDANGSAARLLANVSISKRISELSGKLLKKKEVDAEWVIERMRRLADGNLNRIYVKNGKMLDISEMPEEVSYCIKKIKPVISMDIVVGHEIELHDKTKSLEMLARYLQLFDPAKSISQNLEDVTDQELEQEIKELDS